MRCMPPQRISHDATFAFKFVWPVGWLGFIGTFLMGALLGSETRWGPGITPFWGKTILGVLFGVGVFMVVRLSIPLKRVDEADGSLHISNYLSTDIVPMTSIRAAKVTGDFGHNRMPSVEVWFRERTRYGSKIVFLARSEELLTRFLSELEPEVQVRRP